MKVVSAETLKMVLSFRKFMFLLLPLFSCINLTEFENYFRSFADKYLGTMTMEQLDKYDHLINTIECDWDLFYWSTGRFSPLNFAI